MAQSLCKIYIHIVFHIKSTSIPVNESDLPSLFAYIGGVLKKVNSTPVQIGGTENHVHVLCSLPKTMTLAKLVEEIKRNSSRWIKKKNPHYEKFAWQGGYGAFSVSASVIKASSEYIKNQKQHHTLSTFRDELLLFLKKYKIAHDERYLFTD